MTHRISGQTGSNAAGYLSRFVITCRGSIIDLISIKQVIAVAPPSDNIGEADKFCGSWIELRRNDGKILYLKRIHDLFDDTIEVITGSQGEELSWVTAPGLERTIAVMVPQIPEADHLAIMTRGQDAKDKGALEIARFPVKM
ncbi:MAG: hypothetical protein A2V64_07700 [Bacteroidetes bacterium RBG_13_43_22]|nr:MAG: hypothetical protein A2V64_07700 [Bacteroidetes bacterium RBG_13_43_22]